MTYRFASPELLRLGPPPPLAARDFESLNSQSLADLLSRFNGAGIAYNVANLETDPAVILTQSAAYRDMLRRRAIDDAVAQTYLGSATGAHLDQRAADYGVVRRAIAAVPAVTSTVEPPRPPNVPPLWSWSSLAWVEGDESLRTRARLAWEALSVAGPSGAYVFHALDAHPLVSFVAVYGPETGIVEPGEVLVVVQAGNASGVPQQGVIDAVAARLDAHQVRFSSGALSDRSVRDAQSIRPIGARVLVHAVEPVRFHIEAKLYVRSGPDTEIIKLTAIERLNAYLRSRQRIGYEVPVSAIIAALHVADASGLPIVEEVELLAPLSDIVPAHDQLALVTLSRIEIEVR